MPTYPPSHTARRLLAAAALLALAAIITYVVAERVPSVPPHPPGAQASDTAGKPTPSPSPIAAPTIAAPTIAAPLPGVTTPALSAVSVGSAPVASLALARTAEGRIDPASLATFTPVAYPGGAPAYDGEPVTAYISIPSTGKKVALTVNQLGEFPRLTIEPGEQVEVRLAFTSTVPGTPIALADRDGGRLSSGKVSAALPLDERREVAFGFTVSPNIGMHQISVTTPAGETKTVEFWAGPPSIRMQAAQ